MTYIIIIIIVIFFTIIYYSTKESFGYVTGDCGLHYYVIDGDKNKAKYAANILCKLHTDCKKLLTHLKTVNDGNMKYFIDKIIEEYDEDDLIEDDNESFTIGKGSKIYMCIRSDEDGFYDINLIMFVFLHELSHVGTKEYDHPKEFWNNNIWLMKEAIKIGIYQPVDYSKYPKKYCNGMLINRSPLF